MMVTISFTWMFHLLLLNPLRTQITLIIRITFRKHVTIDLLAVNIIVGSSFYSSTFFRSRTFEYVMHFRIIENKYILNYIIESRPRNCFRVNSFPMVLTAIQDIKVLKMLKKFWDSDTI